MSDEKKTADAAKKSDDDLVTMKVPRKDLQISDEELDKISGGLRASGGYGTLDYKTMTSHGGD
jgi:hypothetical protein